MEELQREAVAQAVLWVPTLFVALALLIFFLILSRLAHFGVLRIVQRTRAHGPLGELLASVARVGLIVLASSRRSARSASTSWESSPVSASPASRSVSR